MCGHMITLSSIIFFLKHAGDLNESSKAMEEARTLDTADRYVNCKSVKYLFRINEIDKAVETAGLFTRVCVHV